MIVAITLLLCDAEARATAKNGAPAPIFFAGASGNDSAPTREITKVGSVVTVYVDTCVVSTVEFEEQPRKSRIAQDFGTIVKHVLGEGEGCASARKEFTSKPLQNERGTLIATAKDANGTVVSTLNISTGPTEHLFLSLDLPVSDKKTLKYDGTSKTLQPTSSSPQLYWTLNYARGDVVDTSKLTGLDSITGKILIQTSSKPLDSFGVGIGYILPKISLPGIDLSSFNFFVAHFWTKQDSLTNGVVNSRSSYASAWRVGISYSLDDALKWVKN